MRRKYANIREGPTHDPKGLRERFGLNHNVEVELTPTEGGPFIHKRTSVQHPVERVYAILHNSGSTAASIGGCGWGCR